MNKTTLAIVIAAIVVLAGSGIAVAIMNNNGNTGTSDKSTNTDGRLQVMGNANHDDYVDSNDVSTIQKIIDDKLDWSKDYPLADANNDGAVDSNDVAMVKKMINHESMTVYYVNGLGKIASISYPAKNIVLAGTTIYPLMLALDCIDLCTGATKTTNIDSTQFAPIMKLTNVGVKAYSINTELLSTINVNCIVTNSNNVYDGIQNTADSLSIDCVRLNADDVTPSSALTIGFLMNKEDVSHKIAKFYDDTLAMIKNKLSTLSEKDRVDTLSIYSYSICGPSYYLTKDTINAGGNNLTSFSDASKSCKTDVEWALELYNSTVDRMVEYTSWGYGDQSADDLKEDFEYYEKYFTQFTDYKDKYFVVNKDLPSVLRVLYVAAELYPSLFSDGIGDEYNQKYVDTFYSYMTDYKVSDHKFLLTATIVGSTL